MNTRISSAPGPFATWSLLVATGVGLCLSCSNPVGSGGYGGGGAAGTSNGSTSGAAGTQNTGGTSSAGGSGMGGGSGTSAAGGTSGGAGRGGTSGAGGNAGQSGGGAGVTDGGADAPESSGGGGSADAGREAGATDSGARDASAGGSGGVAGSGGAAGNGASAGSGGTGIDGGPSTDCNGATGTTVVVVAKDGSGQFTTVQAAIDSVAANNTAPILIRIAPGSYKEKLNIASRRFLTLCGKDAMTTILTYDDNASSAGGTSAGASTTISASDFSAENITFENSTPLGGSQAVALLTSGARMQFRNCRFVSYQDTLYVRGASQYFRHCYIAGSVDFIFGDGTAVFDDCTVYNASGGVAATAPNTDSSTPYGLVFFGGSMTAASSIKAGSVALGRPWGAYGSVTYLHTVLGAHINPVGWVPMGNNDLTYARFAEYKTTGPGSNPAGRAQPSQQLTDAQAATYTLPNVLGSWTPTYSQ